MPDVVIIDTGVANLASIRSAFTRLGAAVTVTNDAAAVEGATRLVLPGVGAFGPAAAALSARGLTGAIRAAAGAGTPLLGVCLGLQLLCDGSDEAPGAAGIGIIPGTCARLPDRVRVPHLGWNRVTAGDAMNVVATGDAAFANSFALTAQPPGWNAAWTVHGLPFVAALERDNLVACQFHPELSGAFGESLLARWLGGPASRGPWQVPVPGLRRRIVACLDVNNGRVVKGVRFQGLRDAGDPSELAARYASQGADEIVVLDIGASAEARETQVETVRRVRAALNIPLTVGGGVRALADAQRLLEAGADRVSVNTAAMARPGLLRELAMAFGRQCVALAIDARRAAAGWEALAMGGRTVGRDDAIAWAVEGESLGAGEILLTSWDADGTRGGHDLDLLRAVSGAVRVPVIASGGIGDADDVARAFAAGADAVLAASVLHDGDQTVATIKDHVASRGVGVRR